MTNIDLNQAAKDFEQNNQPKSYWLEGDFITESTPLSDAFKAGAQWALGYSYEICGKLDEKASFASFDYVDSIEDGGTSKHPWNDIDVERGYYQGFKDGVQWILNHLQQN